MNRFRRSAPIITVGVAAIVLLIVAVAFDAGQVTAQSGSLLWLNPPYASIVPGSSVDLVVQLDDISNVYGAEFHLTFDPAVLSVVDADGGQSGVQIATGSCPAPGFIALNNADNATGAIDYALTQLSPRSPCNGGGVATIEFQCLVGDVTSTVTFASSMISSPDGIPLAHTTQNGTIECLADDLLFADGFESGDLSKWSSSVTDGGDLSVSNAAALVGNYGMQALIDSNGAIYVTDETPNGEASYRARFYFDPNSITMASGNAHFIFYGYSGSSNTVLRMEFRNFNGDYQLRAALRRDGTLWTTSSWYTISDSRHFVELDWRAASAAGVNDGSLTFWIDGNEQTNLTGLDNDTWRVDMVRLGAITGIDTNTRGTYYFDAFRSTRNTYIGVDGVLADFSAVLTAGAPPLTVNFTDDSLSSEPITSYLWDFGDGSTSTEANPVHTYVTEGQFTVTLTASSASAQDTVTKANYITVTDLVFADGFESGDFSAWSAAVTGQGDLSVSTACAQIGTYGMQAVINDNTLMYVRDDSPNGEARYRARFYFDHNSIPMVSGESHNIFVGRSGTLDVIMLVLRYSNPNYQVRVQTRNDANISIATSWYTLTDQFHSLEFDWKAAGTPGANDGYITLWIDGLFKQTRGLIDNDTRRIDEARLGPSSGIDTGTRGTYCFDAFESRRSADIGP